MGLLGEGGQYPHQRAGELLSEGIHTVGLQLTSRVRQELVADAVVTILSEPERFAPHSHTIKELTAQR